MEFNSRTVPDFPKTQHKEINLTHLLLNCYNLQGADLNNSSDYLFGKTMLQKFILQSLEGCDTLYINNLT
jgi:hypothetical protein